jgi:hypothetical protein
MEYPTLPVDIRKINQELAEYFGIDTITGEPIWRLSWSNDQYENRLSEYTPSGIQLITPEIQYLPKYPWIKSRWILERLVIVPDFQQVELAGKQVSYECMKKFEDRFERATQPTFEACKFIVDLVYAALGKSPMPKYIDPESEEPLEAQKARIDKLVEELFGDESDLLGRTVTGEAIIVPRTFQRSETE